MIFLASFREVALLVVNRTQIIVKPGDLELDFGIRIAVRDRPILFDRLSIGRPGPIQVSQSRVNIADPPIGAGRFPAESRLGPLSGGELVVDLEQLLQECGRLGRDGCRLIALILIGNR